MNHEEGKKKHQGIEVESVAIPGGDVLKKANNSVVSDLNNDKISSQEEKVDCKNAVGIPGGDL